MCLLFKKTKKDKPPKTHTHTKMTIFLSLHMALCRVWTF